jgi:hypothetical protein
MSKQSYLIDTNILIGLEDNHLVQPAYASFAKLAAKYNADVFVHEAARDDITRDKDTKRRDISLSKLSKFQTLPKVKHLTEQDLEGKFGHIRKPNDLVDATILHTVFLGAVDFLVTEDKGLHNRAGKISADLARRVLFISDATQLLSTTYEPRQVPIRYVEETLAHTISLTDSFFDSLRDGYSTFNTWWKEKCVEERRECWVVYDDKELAGLVVRKEENADDTDATIKVPRILKVCTFKVGPLKRGIKLGELLLKQVLWYGQSNGYDSVYLTAYPEHTALINLLDFYGFQCTKEESDGELTYERLFEKGDLLAQSGKSTFDLHKLNYPKFVKSSDVRGFCIPIKGEYHDTLFPDIQDNFQLDLLSLSDQPNKPGNTIRKVYLCGASSNLAESGSILFFYKGKSQAVTSQSIAAIGILEGVALATSTEDLRRLAGGRSVYSEQDLEDFSATKKKPVKVINFLLAGYTNPAITLTDMNDIGISYPQSISEVKNGSLKLLLEHLNLGYKT